MSETNKDAAVSFLKLGSSGKVNEAYAKYTDLRFCHHNPYFEGSAQSLAAGMVDNARQFPDKVLEIKHVIAEGDLVVIHSHVRLKPGDLGVALVHIFRFENGRIVELWDLGQPIPEESPNQYGMF
jgi:predicted SnoaL-like aldol condensation-catalyzing enzyme